MSDVPLPLPSGPDDAPKFNTAMTDAGDHGTVLVPAGVTYQILSEINMRRNGVKLRGVGGGSTLHLAGDGTLVANDSRDCLVENLTFTDERASMGTRQGSIFAQAAIRFSVRRCNFVGGGHQVALNGSSGCEVVSCRFTGLTIAANCVFAYLCDDLLLSDVHAGPFGAYTSPFTYPASSGAPRVFQASRCNRVQVIGGSVTNVDMSTTAYGVALALSGTSIGLVTGFTASGNFGAHGIATETVWTSSGPLRSSGILFDRCVSSDNGHLRGGSVQAGAGFDIFDSDSITLVGCTAASNGEAGGHPGINLSRSLGVALRDCEVRQNRGHGIIVASTPEVTLEQVRSTLNGRSGLFVLRDEQTTIESKGIRIIGGDYSTNGRASSASAWERQGVYVSHASTVDLVQARASDDSPAGAKLQQYGVLGANTSETYGLRLDLQSNANGGYAASGGTVIVTHSTV
jgi:hypothetical protein